MATAPINDAFPSPEDIDKEKIAKLVENMQYIPFSKEFIRRYYRSVDQADKAGFMTISHLINGIEVMVPLYDALKEDNERMFKSHSANMQFKLELDELKAIVNKYFAEVSDQYPTEAMNLKGIFGTVKTELKPKFFKTL